MPNSFRGFDFEWEETLVGTVRLKVERTVQTWRSRPEQNVDADGQGTGAGETRRTKTTGKAERGRVKLNANRRRIQKPNGSINETNRANELKTQNEPSERPQTSFLVLNIIVVMLNYESDKERKVFLPDEVQESIDDWIQRVRGVGPGRLFGRILKNGSLNLSRPLDPRSVGMIVQNRLKASQINGKLTAHDLRRTFATRLLDDGIDITTVKNMMGHANITTTARYDRRGEEVQKRAARSVRL